MKILIVKTSSLGDIIQSFDVLDYLKSKFKQVDIDWVVDSSLSSIVAAHPLVRKAIPLTMKKGRTIRKLFQEIKALRTETYDVVFDLQKNTKSGFITAFCRSQVKVGFGLKTVREWLNILATNQRFNVSQELNIRLQYVALLQSYYGDARGAPIRGVQLHTTSSDKQIVDQFARATTHLKIMVCPGSKWVNKQLPVETLTEVLHRIGKDLNAVFYLMWGDLNEKKYCEQMLQSITGIVVDKLNLPTWQNLMGAMDLVIAVDSSALHLCATTTTPSFSLFGPTNPAIFKPIGPSHFAIQGPCPYGKIFPKQCPILRTCPTGACIRTLTPDFVYASFTSWWSTHKKSG